MATWKQYSGRHRGEDKYIFGDFTRGLLRKWTRKSSRKSTNRQSSFDSTEDEEVLDESYGQYAAALKKWILSQQDSGDFEKAPPEQSTWKAASGRKGGPEGYIFGDTTKFILRSLAKSRSDSQTEISIPKNYPSRAEAIETLRKVDAVVSKKGGSLTVMRLQEYFRSTLEKILKDKSIYTEQLDIIWTVLKELNAEQRAEVLVPIILTVVDTPTNTKEQPTDLDSLEAFQYIFDTFLSGKRLSQDQRSMLFTISLHITRQDILSIIAEGMMTTWDLRAEVEKMRKKALDGLTQSFHQAVRSYLSTHPIPSYDDTLTDEERHQEDVSFLFLLAAAQFLPQPHIAQIFSLEQTSWPDLYTISSHPPMSHHTAAAYSPGASFSGDEEQYPVRHSEALLRRMCDREEHSNGWHPSLDRPSSYRYSPTRSTGSTGSIGSSSLFVIDEGQRRYTGKDTEDEVEHEVEVEETMYCYAETGLIIDYLYEVEEELGQHSPFATMTVTSSSGKGSGGGGSGKSSGGYDMASVSSRRSMSIIRPVSEVDLERHIQIVRTVMTPLPFE